MISMIKKKKGVVIGFIQQGILPYLLIDIWLESFKHTQWYGSIIRELGD